MKLNKIITTNFKNLKVQPKKKVWKKNLIMFLIVTQKKNSKL
jgi:hypothetical protein